MTSLNLTSTNTTYKWNFWNIVKIQGANGNTMSVSGLSSNSVINLGNNIDISGNLFANNNFKLPVDITANRPGIVGTNNFYLRYNTTSLNLESYNGSAWVNLLTQGFGTLASLTISGITYTGPFYLTSGGASSGVPVSGGTTYYSITGDTSFVVNSGTAAQGGSGTITPNFSGSIFYIIVGGGGAGGAGTPIICYGGGGGGGGVAAGNTIVSSGRSYFVGVGNGGSSFISTMTGGNGGNSYAFGITATGGIGGDGLSTGFGGSNGFPQRFAGGIFASYGTNPGQGGAGASGSVVYSTAPNYSASNGTNGYNSSIAYSITNSSGTFTTNYFGGGGGGGGDPIASSTTYGIGGLGGGGRGELNYSSANQTLMNGVPGLGGGGGSKRGDDSFYAGMGGSGVIIAFFNTYDGENISAILSLFASTTSLEYSGFTQNLSYSTTIPTASYSVSDTSYKDAGSYTATLTTSSTDYVLGTTSIPWTITKAPLTIRSNDASMTYGSSLPTLAYTISGFKGPDISSTPPITGSVTHSTAGSSTANATTYDIVPNVASLSAANYTFTPVKGTLTINPATLYLSGTASQSFTYNGLSQGPTYSLIGAVASDNGYNISGTSSTNAGDKNVTLTKTSSNYVLGTSTIPWSITKATLTIKSIDKSMTFGSTLPTFDYSITGFKVSDNESVISGSVTHSTAGSSSANVGTYTIQPNVSSLSAINYNFSPSNGSLIITQAVGSISISSVGNTTSTGSFTISTNASSYTKTITPTGPGKSDAQVTENGNSISILNLNRSNAGFVVEIVATINDANYTSSSATSSLTFNPFTTAATGGSPGSDPATTESDTTPGGSDPATTESDATPGGGGPGSDPATTESDPTPGGGGPGSDPATTESDPTPGGAGSSPATTESDPTPGGGGGSGGGGFYYVM
jgi:hypothetical protein